MAPSLTTVGRLSQLGTLLGGQDLEQGKAEVDAMLAKDTPECTHLSLELLDCLCVGLLRCPLRSRLLSQRLHLLPSGLDRLTHLGAEGLDLRSLSFVES